METGATGSGSWPSFLPVQPFSAPCGSLWQRQQRSCQLHPRRLSLGLSVAIMVGNLQPPSAKASPITFKISGPNDAVSMSDRGFRSPARSATRLYASAIESKTRLGSRACPYGPSTAQLAISVRRQTGCAGASAPCRHASTVLFHTEPHPISPGCSPLSIGEAFQ